MVKRRRNEETTQPSKYLLAPVASLRGGTVKDRCSLNDYMMMGGEECRKQSWPRHDFLPATFKCQGRSIGQMFVQHFENCVQSEEGGGTGWGWSHQDHSGGIGGNAFPLHSRGTCLSRACNERMYAMQMHRHIDESSHEGFHEEYASSNAGPMSVDGV